VHIYGVTRQGIQGCVVLVVAVLVVLAPALFTGRVLAPEDNIYFEPPFDGLRAPLGLERPSNPELFDQYRQLHPDMLLARQELHSGELPGWNPFAGAGDPVWASEQHGVASPFEWPAMVLPFWQSLEWVAALKLLAAAVGMFLLLRRLGRSQPASVLGALAFALSSPIIDWLGHPHTNSYVLLPWLFLTIDLVASEGRWRDVVLLAATTGACMAGGHAPSAVMVAYISAAWAVFRFATAPNPRRMALFAGGVVLGVGLAAIAVLPAVELSQHAGSAERHARGSLQTLYSFLVPDYWGRPDRVHTAASRVNYVERTGYFGTVPLILAAVGLAVRRPRSVQLFFIGLTLVSLAFAIKTPLSSLASHLPLMSHVRLVRWVFGAAFGGAALAAFGLDAICERRPSLRVVGFVATLLLLPLLVLSVRHGLAVPRIRRAHSPAPPRNRSPTPLGRPRCFGGRFSVRSRLPRSSSSRAAGRWAPRPQWSWLRPASSSSPSASASSRRSHVHGSTRLPSHRSLTRAHMSGTSALAEGGSSVRIWLSASACATLASIARPRCGGDRTCGRRSGDWEPITP
jgi:Bacterial membrane protein YfhO